jgi:histidinol phosphatase-like PHP family hydrolase
MINDKSKCSIEDFLGQFDFHVHSFSHCVFSKRGELEKSNIMDWSLQTKLAYIKFSLEKICDAARKNGLKMMCVVEHPQFKRYAVPYKDYTDCFEAVKKNAEKDMIVLKGIELDLKIGANGEFYLDKEEMSDGTKDWRYLLDSADIIIGAVHYKDIKDDRRLLKRSFHQNAIKKTIVELSKLRKELGTGAKEKTVVLGHPSGFIGEINEKDYKRMKDGNRAQDHKSFADYLSSKDAAARFLTQWKLEEISRLLYEHNVYPEFNSSYIQKKHSDIRSQEPYPKKTLLETYIQAGIMRGITPNIIPSSDAHTFDEVGVLRLDIIKKRVPNLDKADVPYRPFLG